MSARRRLFVTTGLLALAGVGAAVYALALRSADEAAQRSAAERARLLPGDFPPVDEIRLERRSKEGGVEHIRLRRRGSRWWLVAPVEAPAAEEEVEGLLARLHAARAEGVVSDGHVDESRLQEYGLHPPRIRLTLVGGERTRWIEVGAKNPFDDRLFIRTYEGTPDAADEAPVTAVDGALDYPLSKSVFLLRERRVLPLDPETVERVEVDAVSPAYRLVRDGSTWRAERPFRGRADEGTVRSILDTLARLQAIEFADALPAGRPLGQIRVGRIGGDEEVLELFGVEDGDLLRLWSRGPLGIAQVQADALRRLEFSDFDLREKRLLDVDRMQVDRVVVRVGERTFTLERTDASWQVTEPVQALAATWKVTAALYAIEQLRASAFYEGERSPADLGLDPPKWTVELYAGAAHLGTLRVGARAPSSVEPRRYALGREGGRISIVRERDLKAIPRRLEDVLDAGAAAPR